MNAVMSWASPPRKQRVGIVNAGIDAFCRSNGFSVRDSLRFQTCVEGLFSYCVGNILCQGHTDDIVVSLFWEDRHLKLTIEHSGPAGEWDAYLQSNSGRMIRRTGFDSLGLFIAYDLAQSLIYESRYDLVSGRTIRTYTLSYTMECE